MDYKMKQYNYSCCFCGLAINNKDLLNLQIYSDLDEDAGQLLYAHKECFKLHICKEIPLLFEVDK